MVIIKTFTTNNNTFFLNKFILPETNKFNNKQSLYAIRAMDQKWISEVIVQVFVHNSSVLVLIVWSQYLVPCLVIEEPHMIEDYDWPVGSKLGFTKNPQKKEILKSVFFDWWAQVSKMSYQTALRIF